jgi:transcriptional regulator GlxA family with amidase domain
MARVTALPVAVLAFDGVQLLDVAGPVEVLTTANSFGAHYDVRVVSVTGADVRTSAGVRIGVDAGPDALPRQLNTVIVPGREDWQHAVVDHALIDLVTRLAARSRRVTSVCAGAFPLAATGLLDGRRAATHWQLTRDLASRFPAVTVEADPLFVRDGKIITSAGVTAGIDLCLALVEEDHGPDLARQVARQLVVFMARPGGQSQFSARLGPRSSSHALVRQVMDAVTAHPADQHDADSLAGRIGVSARHLSRLFREEIDLTPGQFVESVRFEAARALLESGTDPVELVAARSGLGSAETLRRICQRTLGVSPTTYRARFRTTGPGSRLDERPTAAELRRSPRELSQS